MVILKASASTLSKQQRTIALIIYDVQYADIVGNGDNGIVNSSGRKF